MTGGKVPLSVAVPGPWWTLLTYIGPLCKAGVRVRVPVGKGTRVGLVVDLRLPAEDYDGELREVACVIDEVPVLEASVLPLLRWFCETYLCGIGTAMKTLLPAAFLRGEVMESLPTPLVSSDAARVPGGVSFIYEPNDEVRFARYAEILTDGNPTVISFPLHSAAKRFAGFIDCRAALPDDVKKNTLIYPRSGAASEWRVWKRLSSNDGTIVVIGAQSSAMAPLREVSRFIVEDESNNAWRTIRPPVYNVRSLVAKRALLEKASLILGGRMPSSRAYMKLASDGFQPGGTAVRRKKIIYVDLKLAYSPPVKGVCDALAVSEPLVRETVSALERDSWAVWILDRRGYAGEIICSECGAQVRCGRCGGAMRWEASASRTSCVVCGTREQIPDTCPACSGLLLSARRPGLEALLKLAKSAMTLPVPVMSLEDEERKRNVAALQSRPGLVLGTRAALSLCDDINVGMIGWIDADGEARSHEYDARTRAFGLMWESLWRGPRSLERTVLLQTRRPGRDWQMGLDDVDAGWRLFWRRELREREEFTMPPYAALVKVEASIQDSIAMAELLDGGGFEFWVPENSAAGRGTIWLRTKRMSALRRVIEPFFHIKRARRGYPSLTVWHVLRRQDHLVSRVGDAAAVSSMRND